MRNVSPLVLVKPLFLTSHLLCLTRSAAFVNSGLFAMAGDGALGGEADSQPLFDPSAGNGFLESQVRRRRRPYVHFSARYVSEFGAGLDLFQRLMVSAMQAW